MAYRNDPAELTASIESAHRTAYPHEVFVVDNSPDTLLEGIARQAGAVYIKTPANLGFGAANNIVLRQAVHRSSFCLVLNPDISFGENVLDPLIEFLGSNPEIGLAMPRILYPSGMDQGLCKLLPSPLDLIARRFLGPVGTMLLKERNRRYEMKNLDLTVPREVPSLSGCFMFMRTDVLREAGLFDEEFFMYMEDIDLCRRIGRYSRTAFYPLVSVNHGYAKGSYRNRKLLYYHLRSAIKYFSKWAWFFDRERKEINRRTSVIDQSHI